jgi:hypothetical protein
MALSERQSTMRWHDLHIEYKHLCTVSDILWRMGKMGVGYVSVEKCQVHKNLVRKFEGKKRHERLKHRREYNIRTVLREGH